MPEQRLRELLQDLHEELSRGENVDEEAETLLRECMDDIHTALGEPVDEGAGGHAGLQDRLRESVDHFEQDHPRLALAVRRVMDALGRL